MMQTEILLFQEESELNNTKRTTKGTTRPPSAKHLLAHFI
jgi:hypothetical protein